MQYVDRPGRMGVVRPTDLIPGSTIVVHPAPATGSQSQQTTQNVLQQTQSDILNTLNPPTSNVLPVNAHPANVPVPTSDPSVTETAVVSTGETGNNIMQWIQQNPLIVAAAVAGIVYFATKRKR